MQEDENQESQLKYSEELVPLFAYVFYGDDKEKRAVLLDSLADDFEDEHAREMKSYFEKTGDFVSFDFMVDHKDFSLTCLPDDILNDADTKVLKDSLLGKLKRQKVIEQALSLARDADGMSFDQINGVLETLMAELPADTVAKERKSLKDLYAEAKVRPRGLLTFFPDVDERIKGVPKGTVLTIAGFVGSFKTTTAVNIMYRNVTELKLNGVMWSTEMPAYLLRLMILIRHAYTPRFSPPCQLPNYADVQKCVLTEEQEDFLFNQVEPDLETNEDYGKLEILEDSDFDKRTPKGVERHLMSLPWEVDFFMLDHVNNIKFIPDVQMIKEPANFYIRAMTEMAKGYMSGKGLSVLLFSQTNRDGWQKAVEAEGAYDLKCLAENNEAERSSAFIMALFADEEMKESKELKYQLLKNRFGQTLMDPTKISINPEFYVIGEDDSGVSSSSTSISQLGGGEDMDLLSALFDGP